MKTFLYTSITHKQFVNKRKMKNSEPFLSELGIVFTKVYEALLKFSYSIFPSFL